MGYIGVKQKLIVYPIWSQFRLYRKNILRREHQQLKNKLILAGKR